jgi:hypothetical protein
LFHRRKVSTDKEFVQIPPVWPVHKRFKRRLANAVKEGKTKVVPEERLSHALIGAPLLPISIFWMGWTSWSGVSIWSPLAASVVFGFAVMQLYISCYQYIIDSYEVFAASALVGMTLTRYCVVRLPNIFSGSQFADVVLLGRSYGHCLGADVPQSRSPLDTHTARRSCDPVSVCPICVQVLWC